MASNLYSISQSNFLSLLEKLTRKYNVVVPEGENNYLFEPFKGDFIFSRYRAITSIRQFLVPAQSKLDTYFKTTGYQRRPFCIVGAKACDLRSLKIQDYVFLDGDVDESYQWFRQNNLIISSDCLEYKDVCFCMHFDINPYPEELFDLNLSLVNGTFVVEVGSEKGKSIIEENRAWFQEAREYYLDLRNDIREQVKGSLRSHLSSQNLPSRDILYELIKNGYENKVWEEEALRCVECGACIMNCPTCHCFLLADGKMGDDYVRSRIWDGCQYKNFARVAGGANPLKFRKERLRNRYIKKFEFFPDRIGTYACTGCGRCIESCIAKIDLREVLRRLHNKGQ